MNSIKKIILSVLFLSTVFVSCSDDDNPKDKKEYDKVAYVVNYGGYGKGNGEISIYDTEKETMTQNGYKTANSIDFSSNIQSMSVYNDVAYLMSNAGDKIDVLDAATLKALGNPVSGDITKPRYFAATGNTAYISCWGNVDDWSVMANSYIATMDLTSKTITKIAVPGGSEGVIIVNNKLFVGSTVSKKITVIDLSNNNMSFISVSGVPQQFVEDGRIVLNTSGSAVRDLNMDNDFISFNARFAGAAMDVFVPVSAVLGIYASENRQGMMFPKEVAPTSPTASAEPEKTVEKPKSGKPGLRLVK